MGKGQKCMLASLNSWVFKDFKWEGQMYLKQFFSPPLLFFLLFFPLFCYLLSYFPLSLFLLSLIFYLPFSLFTTKRPPKAEPLSFLLLTYTNPCTQLADNGVNLTLTHPVCSSSEMDISVPRWVQHILSRATYRFSTPSPSGPVLTELSSPVTDSLLASLRDFAFLI